MREDNEEYGVYQEAQNMRVERIENGLKWLMKIKMMERNCLSDFDELTEEILSGEVE